MGARRRLEIALGVLAAVCLGLFADLAWGILVGYRVHLFDLVAAVGVAQRRFPAGDAFFGALTHLGDGLVITAITSLAVVVLWALRRRGGAVFVAATVASSALANAGLKVLVDRTRPPQMLAVRPIPTSPSFPSGHTVSAFVLFGALAIVAVVEFGPGWRAWAFAAALVALGMLVGFSRLYLGVHWMTDVLGGWLLGVAWLALSTIVWLEVRARGRAADSDPSDVGSSDATGTTPSAARA